MELHLTGLRDEVVQHLTVDHPVYREEDEDLAGDKGSPDFLDKDAVPGDVALAAGRAEFFLVFGLGGIEVALVGHNNPDDLEGLGDDAALGRPHLVLGLSGNEDHEPDDEHQERQQISRPEAHVRLELGGGNAGKTANIDHHIEDHVWGASLANVGAEHTTEVGFNGLQILAIVVGGSTITLSPDFKVLMKGVVFSYCSAIKGETLDLIPPVPRPMTIMAAMRPPKAAPFSMATGREVRNRMRLPTM